jgi:hypothetical protein
VLDQGEQPTEETTATAYPAISEPVPNKGPLGDRRSGMEGEERGTQPVKHAMSYRHQHKLQRSRQQEQGSRDATEAGDKEDRVCYPWMPAKLETAQASIAVIRSRADFADTAAETDEANFLSWEWSCRFCNGGKHRTRRRKKKHVSEGAKMH